MTQKVQDVGQHYPWLDWLRFLAAATVLAVHTRGAMLVEYGALPAGQRTASVAAVYAVTRLGDEAVIVFFVLSGYLVAGKAAERIGRGDFRVADYAVDRAVRVYLPYVPALAFTWACAEAVGLRPAAASLGWNLLALQGVFADTFGGNAPLWSIAYEVWFYILAGGVGLLSGGGGWRVAAGAAVSVAALAVFTVLSPTFLFCWLIGGVAYFVRAAGPGHLTVAVLLGGYSVIGVQLNFASVSVDASSWRTLFPTLAVLQLLLATAVAALIIWLVARPPVTATGRALDRVGTRLAAFSYTLYLIHYPVLRVVEHYLFPRQPELTLRSVGAALAAAVLCVAAAVTSYALFERHTGAVKRWVRRAMTRT